MYNINKFIDFLEDILTVTIKRDTIQIDKRLKTCNKKDSEPKLLNKLS